MFASICSRNALTQSNHGPLVRKIWTTCAVLYPKTCRYDCGPIKAQYVVAQKKAPRRPYTLHKIFREACVAVTTAVAMSRARLLLRLTMNKRGHSQSKRSWHLKILFGSDS